MLFTIIKFFLFRSHRKEVRIPSELKGLFIGKQGRNLKLLTSDTGCEINIIENAIETDAGVMTTIELRGDEGACNDARNRIESFVALQRFNIAYMFFYLY